MMEPWPKREENFTLSPLCWRWPKYIEVIRLQVQLCPPVWNYFKDSLTVHSCCQVTATVVWGQSISCWSHKTNTSQVTVWTACPKSKILSEGHLSSLTSSQECKNRPEGCHNKRTIHMLQCWLSKEWHYTELPVTTKTSRWDPCQLTLTCVGEPPAVFIVAQQASEAVLKLFQVHLRRSDSHHLKKTKAPDRSTGSVSLRQSSHTSHSWYNTHHVGSVDGRGHLDFPEVLAVCELLGAADGSCAAAVVQVKTHLPVVAAEESARRLEVAVPLPVKTCCREHRVTFFFLQIILVTLTWKFFLSFCSTSINSVDLLDWMLI